MKNSVLRLLFLTVLLCVSFQPDLHAQNVVLKAGISKINITPSESLYMGGYDETCRSEPSQGANGNIYVRALVMDDNITRIALVEIDVVSLPRQNYELIRKRISNETGIPFSNIILGCVHNHAAPYPGGKNMDKDWNKKLNENIVKVIREAILDLEPVRMGGGTGISTIAMNRRKEMKDTLSYLTFDENNSSQSYGKYKTDNPVLIREMEGTYRLGSNPDGPIDDEVGVLRIDKLNGKLKAVFVNYACHGTSLGGRNNIISPEWNGYMLEYIENEFPGVTTIFAPGASGDINPRFVGGLEGYVDNHENTKALGYEIGQEVVKTVNGIETYVPSDPAIKLVNESIECPKKYREVVKDFKNTTISVPITGIRIDDYCWITFPGELFHEIGQTLKSSTGLSNTYILGYSNGSLGYMTTQEAYGQGGYEPWSSNFAPVTEKIFVEGVVEMLEELE